jgi:IclR family pca regulon transcriptional regulator
MGAMAREKKAVTPPAAQRANRHFIGAFAKGLAVLRAFGDGASVLSLSEVAERTGLTRAGARRYLLTLQELGYAGHDGRDFFLLPKVLSLGYAYLSSMPLWSFAEPILERLVEDLGETCSLSVLDDTDIVYVLRIPVHRILNAGVTVGSRLPAYCNSMGRVLLGGLSDAQLDGYFARAEIRAFTSRTTTDPAKLRRIIAADRRKTYAWVSGEMQEHIAGLSVPVLDRRGRILAALNVSVNRSGISEKALTAMLLPKLRRAAEQMAASVAITRRS